jgi:hypothetical protein
MAPTNKDSGATRMTGAHVFQAVQHPELDTQDLVSFRDFLKKRVRYLRLVSQNNKAEGVSVTCYALLRMRPLSIPCAECSVVISCGKVDYDKSG